MARPVVAGLLMQPWVRVHSLPAMAIWVESSAETAVCEPRCEGYFRVRVRDNRASELLATRGDPRRRPRTRPLEGLSGRGADVTDVMPGLPQGRK